MENFLVSLLGTVYPANDMMAGMLVLYAEVFGLISFVLFAIANILYVCIVMYSGNLKKRVTLFTKEQEMLLDVVFLVFPTLAILYILVPTLGFIFNSDFANIDTFVNINVIGHQWYWTYEYYNNLCVLPGFANINIETMLLQIDSFMDTEATINRLLEVTNRLVIPVGHFVGLHITAADVIHSFALPQLGIKVDAIPGRIAQATLFVPTSGVFRGQCSELCGAYHGFMPIVLEVIKLEYWYDWYCANLGISPSAILLSDLSYCPQQSASVVTLFEAFDHTFVSHRNRKYSPAELRMREVAAQELYWVSQKLRHRVYMLINLHWDGIDAQRAVFEGYDTISESIDDALRVASLYMSFEQHQDLSKEIWAMYREDPTDPVLCSTVYSRIMQMVATDESARLFREIKNNSLYAR